MKNRKNIAASIHQQLLNLAQIKKRYFSILSDKLLDLRLILKFISILIKTTPYQSVLLSLLICVQGLMPALTIKLSGFIINVISNDNSNDNVYFLSAIWASSILIYNLINPWIIFFQGNIADKAVNHINEEIIKKSNNIEGLYVFEDEEFYNNIQILQTQASHKPLNLVVSLVGIVKDFVIITGCIILLYGQIKLLVLAVVFSAFLHFKIFSKLQSVAWQESLGRSSQSRFINYLSSLSINKASAKEIRFFELGSYLLSEYKKIFFTIYSNIFKTRLQQVFLPTFPLVFSTLINMIAFGIVASKVNHGVLALGSFIILLQSLSQLHLSVSSFGEQSGWLTGHLLFFKKYFQFLDIQEQVFPCKTQFLYKSKVDIENIISIKFDSVSFRYNKGNEVISNLNLTINNGERIAIVGSNGAGKSTLIKLICGFYQPCKGRILINDVPMDDIDILKWRQKISPVFQDFNQYHIPLEQNIVMGNKIDEAKLNKIIFDCDLNDLVERFPNGIKQQLGQPFGGSDLSGGQWQKIAIARAFYKDAELFILDEPTAALDPIIENEIFALFKGISSHKTIIYITHRLGTISLADRILVLENGHLIGDGVHRDLIKNNTLYKKMYTAQSRSYLIEEEYI